MTLYEYLFNERIQTLLRLGDLFEWLDFSLMQEHPLQHRVALITLFEVVDVTGRADLKSDPLKEPDHQRQTLIALRVNPQIDQDVLDAVISELGTTSGNLVATHGKTGQLVADNEWLMSVRSRAIIPGRAHEFDLPAYLARQHHPTERRRTDIVKWVQLLVPLCDATMIVLWLLRESGQNGKVIINAGSYQQMLSSCVYQLMQVRLDESALEFAPEISANKHMFWVRFTQQDGDLRSKPAGTDIPFRLKFCNS